MTSPDDQDGGQAPGAAGGPLAGIPSEVFTRTAKTLLTAFEKLVAPLTEATSGFGRYIRQKFNNMVEVEKALATFALERACEKAAAKAKKSGMKTLPPAHPKSFVKSLEEASKETDPILHEMWASLLASQLLEGGCHPHFVEILSHFGPAEAKLLAALRPADAVGPNGGNYIFCNMDQFTTWVDHADDPKPKPWTESCILLHELGFADVLSPKDNLKEKKPPILYLTRSGVAFLDAVTL